MEGSSWGALYILDFGRRRDPRSSDYVTAYRDVNGSS
jgi:hypothetical protein